MGQVVIFVCILLKISTKQLRATQFGKHFTVSLCNSARSVLQQLELLSKIFGRRANKSQNAVLTEHARLHVRKVISLF